MAISSGTRLGPYEVVSPLGAGGMGEVWKARDTRLERSVAIKVLPAEFAENAQLKLRFEREAKTISQLNHPHICTLYDVGDGYLVMELLEGESLADKLAKGPLPLDQVLRYGIEIAEALDKAHKAGITHRDLKPGNVMITKSGAKLLDFGLAKPAKVFDATAATQHKPLTQEGSIVGTFQYMAPEQIEGADVDARTDIFALGAVLYEMATGRRAFIGKSNASLIANILGAEPQPISTIAPMTPAALDRLVRTCLQKEPDERWQNAHDVATELRWIAEIPATEVARPKRRGSAWLLNVLVAIIAVAITWGVTQMRKERPRLTESTILPPDKAQFAFEVGGAPALSPDGSKLVFAASLTGGRTMLYVRHLSGGTAQPLGGTEDALSPFWSPDSASIGFFVSGKLKKIDAAGGAPQTLADAQASPRGGSWSKEGVIVFAPALTGGLFKVGDAGGTVTPVTSLTANDSTHRYPWFLPDGRHFVYVSSGPGPSLKPIMLGSIDGGAPKEVTRANSNAIYANGYLFFIREHTLFAQTFDPKTFVVGREAVPVAEQLTIGSRLDGCFTVANDGTLVYESSAAPATSQLTWYDLSGKVLGQIGKPLNYSNAAISHDGKRVATSIVDAATGHSDIWIEDLVRGTTTRLTFDPSDETGPIWSPDDSKIFYTSDAKSPGDIMVKSSSGTGAEEMVYGNPAYTIAYDVSPDGKTIAFVELDPKNSWDMWLFSMDDHKPRILLRTPFSEIGGRFSLDGKWVAYHSNESGLNQVYVMPVSGGGSKWQISTDGGDRVRWSRDGKQLFYQSPDYKLMVVDVTTRGAEFNASVPRALFPMNIKRILGTQYDIAPDGKRVLINSPVEQAQIAPLTLVQNWTAKIK